MKFLIKLSQLKNMKNADQDKIQLEQKTSFFITWLIMLHFNKASNCTKFLQATKIFICTRSVMGNLWHAI